MKKYRELTVRFQEDGSVRYAFHRSGFKTRLSRYLVEHPASLIEIGEGANVRTADLRQTTGPRGIELTWEKSTGTNQSRDTRHIVYTKLEKLEVVQDSPRLLKFQERFRVKRDCFHLYLHQRSTRISAVKSRSGAFFNATSHGYIHACNSIRRGGNLECWETQVTLGTQVPLPQPFLPTRSFTVLVNWSSIGAWKLKRECLSGLDALSEVPSRKHCRW